MPLYVCLPEPRRVVDENLESLHSFLQNYNENFIENAKVLTSQVSKHITESDRCLFIGQREIGSTGIQDDSVLSIGTDMMTTCHAVVARCPLTKATSLGHFDGMSTSVGVKEMLNAVHDISILTCPELANTERRKIDLHIAGGFNDDMEASHDLSLELLHELHCIRVDFCLDLEIHLKTFCCSPLNNTLVPFGPEGELINSPMLFSLGVNVQTGEIFPVQFSESTRQPCKTLRSARTFHGRAEMTNMYRWEQKSIEVEPFTWEPFPSAVDWAKLPDDIIKTHMSTSPEVEPEEFVPHMRSTLLFIADNPNPLQSLFADGKPICFQRKEAGWIELKSS